MTRIILPLCFLILCSSVHSQNRDARTLLNRAKMEYEKIKDFQAQAEIILNVDFIKIPNKYATVYYKYPDKYRFKSKGFIMVPKKGLNFSISEIMNQPATLVYSGMDTVNRQNCDEIKILPDDPKSEVVLATLYIDSTLHFVRKMEAITRKSGSYTVELFYNQTRYPLPSEIKINFDVEKLDFPLKFMGDVQVKDNQNMKPEEANVKIKYTGYKVNEGVKDDVFNEEEINK